MDRGTTVAYQTEVAAAQSQPIYLVSIAFDSPTGTIYLTNCGRQVVYGGNTYLSTGHLLGVGDLEEAAGLGQQSLQLSLSGVGQTYLALLLTENYLGRVVTVYKAFLDSSGAVVSDPLLHFRGTCDEPVISEDPDGGTCVIALQAVNGGNKGRRIGRCTNTEDQRVWFPLDHGFDFVPLLQGEQIPWGRRTQTGGHLSLPAWMRS